MRDSTIITHADVYMEGIPGTSDSVMMSGDSPPPLQTTISLVDCDMPDDARSGKISPTIPTTPITTKLLNSDTDTEAIENAVSVVQKVLPVPEPEPKIERNGIDTKAKKPVNQTSDDSCVIDCIYYTQQCCECVII